MNLQNIEKSYDGKKVLNNVSFELENGGVYMISGVSGRGKTTLLRIMMGLEKPDSGNITDIPEKISAVFQEDRLYNAFTPLVSIKAVCGRSVTPDDIRSHLAQVGLEEYADKPVSQLSGGMKRRVSIVRAIIVDADVIFLDEPFTGLDRDTKIKVIEYIAKYTSGKTLICVSHDAEDAQLMNAKTVRI